MRTSHVYIHQKRQRDVIEGGRSQYLITNRKHSAKEGSPLIVKYKGPGKGSGKGTEVLLDGVKCTGVWDLILIWTPSFPGQIDVPWAIVDYGYNREKTVMSGSELLELLQWNWELEGAEEMMDMFVERPGKDGSRPFTGRMIRYLREGA